MSDSFNQQLNILIVICSMILSIALTHLLLSGWGILFYIFAGIITLLMIVISFYYLRH